jgi:hypothetical protein
MPIIPALGRLRLENYDFKTSLRYIINSRSAWVNTVRTQQKKILKNFENGY